MAAIALPRAPTAELTMQVHHNGAWHRRTPDLARTACGDRLHTAFTPVRHETLTAVGDLCETCFTPFELGEHAEAEAWRKHQEEGG